LVVVLGFLGLAGGALAEENVKIVILGTSDTHSNLYGFSYEDNKETSNNGMARIATYVQEVRAENPYVILLDNGDTYQGTILADAIYNKKDDVVHPVSKVYNYLNYDALVLGNHEFNFGLEFVERIQNELEFPVLAANAVYEGGQEFTKPYLIVEKAGVKIGIIGLTNPNAPRWDGEKVDGIIFDSITASGKKYGKQLLEEEKVDLLVVVAHVGMTPEFDEEEGSDGAAKLLAELPEINVLLLGHYHTNSAERIGNTLVASPRSEGRDIVRYDLELAKKGDGYEVVKAEVVTVDMTDVVPDQALRELIQEEHAITIDFISGGGGLGAEIAGGGIFGQAGADFQPPNEIRGIPEGKIRDTAVIELIAKVQLEVSGADVTAVALFQDNSDLKKGDINYGSLFSIYKFDNTLYTVDVTGKELKAYMEWSASHYNTWKPGDISISFDPDVPGYLYDMFKGVDYKIDLSQPVGSRIVDVMFKGKPLEDDQVLVLAVNNYRYSSGLKAFNLVEANRRWYSSQAIREYLAEYIEEQGVIYPEVSNNWQIVGVDLNHPLREEIIALVNDKKIHTPYNNSLNIQELEKQGIIQNGKVIPPTEDIGEEQKSR
jgi:2',3'-cyclic-nucleotide 2'-phosphodiesterase/3'-nucleotidase